MVLWDSFLSGFSWTQLRNFLASELIDHMDFNFIGTYVQPINRDFKFRSLRENMLLKLEDWPVRERTNLV